MKIKKLTALLMAGIMSIGIVSMSSSITEAAIHRNPPPNYSEQDNHRNRNDQKHDNNQQRDIDRNHDNYKNDRNNKKRNDKYHGTYNDVNSRIEAENRLHEKNVNEIKKAYKQDKNKSKYKAAMDEETMRHEGQLEKIKNSRK